MPENLLTNSVYTYAVDLKLYVPRSEFFLFHASVLGSDQVPLD